MKFSIIIPCYNVGGYLLNTVESVTSQLGAFDLEIILIDDYSIDDTTDIIRRLSLNKDVKCFFNTENRGVSYSRNLGIANATGDYVYFLDGDDILISGSLDKIYKNLCEHNDIDLYSFGFKTSYRNLDQIFIADQFHNQIFDGDKFLRIFLQRRVKQCMCSFIVKRELLLDNLVSFDLNTYAGEDQEVQIKCMYYSRRIFYDSTVYFIYQMRQDSFMKSSFSQKRVTSMEVYLRLKNLFARESFLTTLNTYFSLEYLSLLKHAAKTENQQYISMVLAYQAILGEKMECLFNRQALMVLFFKNWHKFSLQTLLFLFKRSK